MFTGHRIHFIRNDKELFRNIGDQEDEVFRILYKKYWRSLLDFAAHYLQDEDSCQEIVQDLFIHLHSRNATLQIRSSVSSYLYAALRNRIFNYMRNQSVYKKHLKLAANEMAIAHNNVDQFINLTELQKTISFFLNQMPDKYREVYVLHRQYHFTIKRIGFILKRPPDTVEKQLRKATALMRDHLKQTSLTER